MSDLTDKIRAKFPDDYKDMSDSDLESAVLSKHPEYKDLSSDTKIESKPVETKVAEHPNKLSELWNSTVNNPTVKKLLTGTNDAESQLMKDKGITNIQGPGLMTIPELDKLGETIKNKGINSGDYWKGFGGSLAKDLIDLASSGFDPRAAGIHKSPNDLFPVDHDYNPNELTDIKAKTPEIARRAMSNQPSLPRSNNPSFLMKDDISSQLLHGTNESNYNQILKSRKFDPNFGKLNHPEFGEINPNRQYDYSVGGPDTVYFTRENNTWLDKDWADNSRAIRYDKQIKSKLTPDAKIATVNSLDDLNKLATKAGFKDVHEFSDAISVDGLRDGSNSQEITNARNAIKQFKDRTGYDGIDIAFDDGKDSINSEWRSDSSGNKKVVFPKSNPFGGRQVMVFDPSKVRPDIINPNEAVLAEDTIGKQIAAHRANELDKVRGSASDIPNNDVARQLELERTGKQPLSVDEVNKLFTNTKPLEEGTIVNFKSTKYKDSNLRPKSNEPIIINDPKELNTDQIRKVYMKENPSNTSSPNILMQAPDVNKVKEANSYGYKSAGYTQDGSLKLERKGTYPKTINPVNKESLAQSIYDLPRGLMSVDPPFITSAAFRQAGPLIGTKQWFKSWIPSAKAFGSELTSKTIEDSIQSHPLVKDTLDASGNIKPGYAKRIGIKFTSLDQGLNNREEAIRNDLAEKIPIYGKYVRASNRAYTTFLNTLKLGTLEDIVNGATADQSIGSKLNPFSLQSFGNSDPLNNAVLGKQIGDFINNATGRGSLGPLEDHVKLLSNVLFSPRGIAAKVQMFNPMNYVATEPLVRQQYIKAAARQAGAWWAMAGLSTLAGATVSRDPNSADFGKIKIGNTRIDPPGGLQQFLVLGNRMLPESMGGGGITSTTTNKFKSFGSGFKPNTRMSTLGQFGINRLHPTLKLAYDFLDANPNKPFHVGDQMISHVAPLFAGDLMDVAKDNPGLLPIVLPLAGAGMGTQSYEKGSFGKSTFLPEDMDINVGAK